MCIRGDPNQNAVGKSRSHDVSSPSNGTAVAVCDFSADEVARDPWVRCSAVRPAGGSLRILNFHQGSQGSQVRPDRDLSARQLYAIEFDGDLRGLPVGCGLNTEHTSDDLGAGMDLAPGRER